MSTTNITLPLDVIDSIIISNPNIIYTLYSKISNNYVLLEHLQNNQLYYFNKSSYLKYFLNTNTNTKINIISVVENYTLLEKYIHNKTIINSGINLNEVNDVMFNLEAYLDNNLSIILLDKYMNNFMKYYKLDDTNESPDFIKLYIILKACNYFPTNNNDFGNFGGDYYQNLTYLINAILEDEEILFSNNYSPEYKFIPVFRISLGMGYGFIIGWDMFIDRMIGFVDGGSDGHEVEYNKMMIQNYLTLDRKQRFLKYERKIGSEIGIDNKIVKKNNKKQKIDNKRQKITQQTNNSIEQSTQSTQNILKYLELFSINQSLINLENPFEYLAEHRLNILGQI